MAEHDTITYRMSRKNIGRANGEFDIFMTNPIRYGIMLSHPILYHTWSQEPLTKDSYVVYTD